MTMEFTPNIIQIFLGNGDDWHMLDIRVPFLIIGAHVVHIMGVLPPSNADT